MSLSLRPVSPSDLDAVHAVHADPRTNEHNPAGPHTDLEQSRALLDGWLAHWDQHGFGYWAAEADGEVVGFGGVRTGDLDGEKVLNLYYRFRPESWGNGYATVIARRAVAWAREHRRGDRVVAQTRIGNDGGRRTALRAGLRPAGETLLGAVPTEVLATPPLQPAAVRAVDEVDGGLRDRLLDIWVEVTTAGGAVGFLPGATAGDHAPVLDDHLARVGEGGWTLGLVEVDGEVAGFGFLVPYAAAVMTGRAQLIRLMVDPRWEGQGVGGALLTGLEELAWGRGFHLLDATYRSGMGLGAFYARHGWAEVGRLQDGLTVAPDDLRDAVWVARRR